MSADLVITGGHVIDGTGQPRIRADVAITDGRIVDIGFGLSGNVVLEADGQVVAPGFIDIHTHYDAQVFFDPALIFGTAPRPTSWSSTRTPSRLARCVESPTSPADPNGLPPISQQIVALCHELGRPVATPAQSIDILGLPTRDRVVASARSA